jgi:N-alpha-acetyltransferase 60
MSEILIQNYNLQNEIQLRFLCPFDIDEVKELCADWFPVHYPEQWYIDITSNSNRFYSLAATFKSKIIGMIIAETKQKRLCDLEDKNVLLSNKFNDDTLVTYILSLGVVKEYRRLGIASILLQTLISYLRSTSTSCKAVYLHVLSTNDNAIRFYEKRGFKNRCFLPKYYSINKQLKDAYCYVLYMNNGYPPWSFIYPFFKKLTFYAYACSLN